MEMHVCNACRNLWGPFQPHNQSRRRLQIQRDSLRTSGSVHVRANHHRSTLHACLPWRLHSDAPVPRVQHKPFPGLLRCQHPQLVRCWYQWQLQFSYHDKEQVMMSGYMPLGPIVAISLCILSKRSRIYPTSAKNQYNAMLCVVCLLQHLPACALLASSSSTHLQAFVCAELEQIIRITGLWSMAVRTTIKYHGTWTFQLVCTFRLAAPFCASLCARCSVHLSLHSTRTRLARLALAVAISYRCGCHAER